MSFNLILVVGEKRKRKSPQGKEIECIYLFRDQGKHEFYHNWGISLALIGRELFDKSDDHGNDVMVALFSEKIQQKLGK